MAKISVKKFWAILAGILILGGLAFAVLYFSRSSQPLRSDINQDGRTDTTDYQMLLNSFGLNCADCPEDINHDGHVDGDDLLIVLGDMEMVK